MTAQKEFTLTPRRRGFHLVTEEIIRNLPPLPSAGILHLFIKHTSAGLTINENADPDVQTDMEAIFNRLVKEREPYYQHTCEGDDDMPAHAKATLSGTSLTIPITNGRLNIGIWQGIYLCEFRNRGGGAALSGLPRSEERLEADCEVRLHAGAEPRLEEERMDVTQGKLALGFRTGGITCWEEDYPALVMCNAVFGATPLSKLFLNVREKRSLCYYASSNLEKMKGLLLVSSGIEFGQYQQARDEILAQLGAIRRGEMEDWELEGARRTLIGGHRSTLDDQSRLEEFWLGQTAAGLDTGIEELVERLKTVTREQVAAAAQKLELDTVYFLNGKEG